MVVAAMRKPARRTALLDRVQRDRITNALARHTQRQPMPMLPHGAVLIIRKH